MGPKCRRDREWGAVCEREKGEEWAAALLSWAAAGAWAEAERGGEGKVVFLFLLFVFSFISKPFSNQFEQF